MTNAKLHTWQLWAATKKALGESVLFRVFGKRDARIVRMCAQDPRFTADRCHDPIENLHTTLSMLDEVGRGDIARRIVGHLSSAIDGEGYDLPVTMALLPTMDAEQLEDFQAVADMARAINEGEPLPVIMARLTAAKEALERTVAKHLEG